MFVSAGRVVSDICQDAVAAFNIDRSKHINKDLLLGGCIISGVISWMVPHVVMWRAVVKSDSRCVQPDLCHMLCVMCVTCSSGMHRRCGEALQWQQ